MNQTRPGSNQGTNSLQAKKLRALFPLILFVAAYLFFWSAPEIKLVDPWHEAFSQVNVAVNTRDPVLKQKLLDLGGGKLKELCAQYPYHARIHYMLGCYFEFTGQYDSAIVQAQEALRLGSGGTANRVDDIATNVLLSAKAKKEALIKK